jgi:hypothetical protein
MLSLRERAFLNLILLCALGLFLVLEIFLTYTIGKLLFSLVGGFCLVIVLFLLLVNLDTWRKIKEE